MTKIDQFESVFRSADKPLFRYDPFAVNSVLVMTDLEGEKAEAFSALAEKYLGASGEEGGRSIRLAAAGDFSSIEECLGLIDEVKPDLVCTYRGLHSECWRWGHSLGSYVEVLTQGISTPVLVFPHPGSREALSAASGDCTKVMAMTDHLAGDSRLINAALFFTREGGVLHLANFEDRQVFERYMDAIGRIPSIDSDQAREDLLDRLLREARDYIQSCRLEVETQGNEVEITETVDLGLHVEAYRQLVRSNGIELLVMNTKEKGQLAMHGLAYALAVEVNEIPLLLL
ncbi:MAG: hypothetical protein VX675_05900 [Planctomycetota bacterium]|nr:hypothetical protein [Planctomycetota bacterium]